MIRAHALAAPFPSIRLGRAVLLWATIIGLGAILRLRDLGARPLDPDEARLALEAFRGVGFGRPWGSPESMTPGYTGMMSLIFYLFGSSDAAARLLSAVAGVGVIALSALAIPFVGTAGVLGIAALLATSPILLEASRSALNASMVTAALFTLVLVLARIIQGLELGQPVSSRWFLALGGAGVVGLATDPLFTLNVLALLAALVFAFDLGDIRARLRGARSISRWSIVLGASLAIVIYTTRFLTNPGGLQSGLIDPLWLWTTELLQPARIPLVPLLLVLATECLIVVTALGGVVQLKQATALERFAAAWLAITFAIAIIGGRSDFRFLAPVILAGALLGGPWLARTVQNATWREPMTYILGAIAVVPLLATLVASLSALSKSSAPEPQLFYAGLAGFAGTVIGGLAIVGRRTVVYGLLFAAFGLATIATVIGDTRLSSAAAYLDLGKAGPGAVFTGELEELNRRFAIWEWIRTRPILVDDRLQSLLGWALRSNRNVRWVEPGGIPHRPPSSSSQRVAKLFRRRIAGDDWLSIHPDNGPISPEGGRVVSLASVDSTSGAL